MAPTGSTPKDIVHVVEDCLAKIVSGKCFKTHFKGYVRHRGTFRRGSPYRGTTGQIVKGTHELIDSEDLWEKCQIVRSYRRQTVKTHHVDTIW
jgi:hypothetical protein